MTSFQVIFGRKTANTQRFLEGKFLKQNVDENTKYATLPK